MAANHTALRVERQDLFEDQLRGSNTRSVRRASGLVLAIYSAVQFKQLVSASAHVLLMSRDSCSSLGQKLRFYGMFSLNLLSASEFGQRASPDLQGGTQRYEEKQTQTLSRTVGVQPAGCYRSVRPNATGSSLSLCCTQSSGALSRATTSSAQVGDRYVGGPTRKAIR
jgi:hypothetical protein